MKLCRIKFYVFLKLYWKSQIFCVYFSGIDKAIALLRQNSCDHSYETLGDMGSLIVLCRVRKKDLKTS